MTLEQVKQLNIPKKPGIYQYFNEKGEIIYVGKAANLNSRVLSYWQKSADHTPAKNEMLRQIVKIKWIETDSEIEALLLESNFIKKHQPQFNVLMRDDKRYAYVKISLEDEIPGIFVTRTISKSGKYFGPFVSTTAVKETLKTIRKIWPYCTAKKIQKKPCFYFHVGRCLGICGGYVSGKEYMEKVIKPIILFFEGKKNRIIKNYELKIKNIEKILKKNKSKTEKYIELENELHQLKFKADNINQVLDHANILGLIDKYATDVVELAKILGLPRVPERIEGYDISNIFGQEAVGSMVVFTAGEPDKNEYRKFKIRIGQGQANDTGMLKEVLIRRFARTKIKNETESVEIIPGVNDSDYSEENGFRVKPGMTQWEGKYTPPPQDGTYNWPAPDLIIIDGGKGQVNVAAQVLKKYKLDIPVIGISKGLGLRSAIAPDKLFFPGEKKPLQLPLASPALHLIKRVRDEAHRFAITYHRKLRSKEWLK